MDMVVSKLHWHINLVLFHCDEQKCKCIFHMNKTLLALCINHCIDIFISIYTNINVDLHRPSNCSCMHKLWITSIELYNFTISFNLLVHASNFFPKHVTYFSRILNLVRSIVKSTLKTKSGSEFLTRINPPVLNCWHKKCLATCKLHAIVHVLAHKPVITHKRSAGGQFTSMLLDSLLSAQ